MARRKSDPLGGFVVILCFAGIALFFVAIVLANVAFYGIPFFIVAVLIFTRQATANPPVLPVPDAFDDQGSADLISRDLGGLFKAIDLQERIYEGADNAGLIRTKASGENRYDIRKKMAREINSQLDDVESAIAELIIRIRDTRASVFESIPDWQTPFLRWSRLRSLRVATTQAIAGAMLACLVIALLTKFGLAFGFAANPLIEIAKGLFWRPFNDHAMAALLTVVVIGYVTFGLSYFVNIRLQRNKLDSSVALRLIKLANKWNPSNDVTEYFSASEYIAARPSEDGGTDAIGWWNVLGVSRDAVPADIKTAFREAIKGYHSDRVASLGPKLRELAEEESKKINAAYSSAKRELGFR